MLSSQVILRGVADGGGAGVRTPALLKTGGGRPPEIWIFRYLFLETYQNFRIFHHFENKVAEIT